MKKKKREKNEQDKSWKEKAIKKGNKIPSERREKGKSKKINK